MIEKIAEYTKQELLKELTDINNRGSYPHERGRIREIMLKLTELKCRKAVPVIEKFMKTDDLYIRACAVYCMEEFGSFKGISHSGLLFPGTLTVEEIKTCLKLVDENTFKHLAKLWSPIEKNRILLTCGKSEFESMISSLSRAYRTFTDYSSYSYKESIERINMIMDLLSRAGDIKLNKKLSGTELKILEKDTPDAYESHLKSMEEERVRNRGKYLESMKGDKSIKQFEAALKNTGPVSFDKNVYIEFFDRAFDVSRKCGLLMLEEYVAEMKNEFLKSGIQLLCNGTPEEEVVLIMDLKKKKMIHEYETLLDLITGGICGITRIVIPDHYRDLLRSY